MTGPADEKPLIGIVTSTEFIAQQSYQVVGGKYIEAIAQSADARPVASEWPIDLAFVRPYFAPLILSPAQQETIYAPYCFCSPVRRIVHG